MHTEGKHIPKTDFEGTRFGGVELNWNALRVCLDTKQVCPDDRVWISYTSPSPPVR